MKKLILISILIITMLIVSVNLIGCEKESSEEVIKDPEWRCNYIEVDGGIEVTDFYAYYHEYTKNNFLGELGLPNYDLYDEYMESITLILEIPSSIDGNKVVSIGENFIPSFTVNRSDLEEIIIPESVTNIHEKAFSEYFWEGKITVRGNLDITNISSFEKMLLFYKGEENKVAYELDYVIINFPQSKCIVEKSENETIYDFSYRTYEYYIEDNDYVEFQGSANITMVDSSMKEFNYETKLYIVDAYNAIVDESLYWNLTAYKNHTKVESLEIEKSDGANEIEVTDAKVFRANILPANASYQDFTYFVSKIVLPGGAIEKEPSEYAYFYRNYLITDCIPVGSIIHVYAETERDKVQSNTIEVEVVQGDEENVVIMFYLNNGMSREPLIKKNGSVIDENTLDSPGDAPEEGFIFAGWYLDSSLTKELTYPYTLTKNITVYAKFVEETDDKEDEETYTISFVTNSETTTIEDMKINVGETLSFLPGGGYNDGKTFVDWYLDEDLTEAFEIPYTLTTDIILYAKWE